MNKRVLAIAFALLAAGLYAINIPLSKLLLDYVEPTMMASYLYLGAGLGIGVLFLATRKMASEPKGKITKRDLPNVLGMIVLDIAAPILLMFGLLDSMSSSASLLNNFEIVCTSMIALFVFKESVSKRMWLAIALITLSSFFLSFEDISSFKPSLGAVLVLLATLCWGLENNCTKNLSNKNTYHIVFLKGIFSGIGSLIVALCLRESFGGGWYIILAMLLGFVAYGLSIFFYIKAQGIIGASKTSAYYSVAPFIGTLLSFIVFDEKPNWAYFVGLAIMCAGTIIVVIDTLAHTHTHAHTHNGVTHSHQHNHFLSEDKHHHHHKIEA